MTDANEYISLSKLGLERPSSAASIISGAIQRIVPPIWVIVANEDHLRTSVSMTDDNPKSARQAEPSAPMRMLTWLYY